MQKLLQAKIFGIIGKVQKTYIRDEAIYERVTNYKTKGAKEINNNYCESNREIQSIVKNIKHICKFAAQISELNREELFRLIKTIYKMQITIRDLITKKFDFEMWQEINRNKTK